MLHEPDGEERLSVMEPAIRWAPYGILHCLSRCGEASGCQGLGR